MIAALARSRTYLLPVLWLTSRLHTMAGNRRRKEGVYSKRLDSGQQDLTPRRILNMVHRGQHRPGAKSDTHDCLAKHACLSRKGWALMADNIYTGSGGSCNDRLIELWFYIPLDTK